MHLSLPSQAHFTILRLDSEWGKQTDYRINIKAKLNPDHVIWGLCAHNFPSWRMYSRLYLVLEGSWGQCEVNTHFLASAQLHPHLWTLPFLLIQLQPETGWICCHQDLCKHNDPSLEGFSCKCPHGLFLHIVQDSAHVSSYWRRLYSFPSSLCFSPQLFLKSVILCISLLIFCFPTPECKLYEGKALFIAVFSGPTTALGT